MKKLPFIGFIAVIAVALAGFAWAMDKDPGAIDFVLMFVLGSFGMLWFLYGWPSDFSPVIRGALGWLVSGLAATVLLAFIVGIIGGLMHYSPIPGLTKLGLAAAIILAGATLVDAYLCLIGEGGAKSLPGLWRRRA